MSGTGTVWGSLERFRAKAFLVAAGLFVVFAVLWGAAAVAAFAPRPAVDVFGPAGWAMAFLGLVGLYAGLADRTPWLARAAVVFAAVGVVGAVVTAAVNLGQLADITGEPPAWFAAINLLIMVGIVPGFFAFATAVLRTDVQSRTVGLLLLVPASVFVVNFVRVAALGPRVPTGAPFVLGSSQALALLAIGLTLRTGGPSSEPAGSPADATP